MQLFNPTSDCSFELGIAVFELELNDEPEGALAALFCHVGNVLAPLLVNICPAVPSPETCCSGAVDVVPPQTTSYGENEATPRFRPLWTNITTAPEMQQQKMPCSLEI